MFELHTQITYVLVIIQLLHSWSNHTPTAYCNLSQHYELRMLDDVQCFAQLNTLELMMLFLW